MCVGLPPIWYSSGVFGEQLALPALMARALMGCCSGSGEGPCNAFWMRRACARCVCCLVRAVPDAQEGVGEPSCAAVCRESLSVETRDDVSVAWYMCCSLRPEAYRRFCGRVDESEREHYLRCLFVVLSDCYTCISNRRFGVWVGGLCAQAFCKKDFVLKTRARCEVESVGNGGRRRA